MNSGQSTDTADQADLTQVLFESASDALLLVAPSSLKIIDANRVACDLVNDDRENLIARSLVDVLRFSESSAEKEIKASLINRDDLNLTCSVRLPSGSAELISVESRHLHSSGEVVSLLTLKCVDRHSVYPTEFDLLKDVEAIVWECKWPSLEFTYVSQQAESILGYPVTEWKSNHDFWMNMVHPDDLDRSIEYCQSCTLLGIDHEFDYRAISAAGETVWLHDVVHVVKNAHGEPVRLRGLMVDISKRRKAEEELRRSEAERERAERFAMIMKVEVGLDGRWKRIPPTLCDFLGYTESELYAGHCSDVTHEDDRAEDALQIQRLVNGEIRSFEREKRYVRRDGKTVWAYINCSLVRGESGDPAKFLTYIQDVTERKSVEEAVRLSDERHRMLVNGLAEGVTLYDRNMNLLASNESACRILGLTKTQLEGRSLIADEWRTITTSHEPYLPKDYPASKTLKSGVVLDNQIMGVHQPDGILRWISINTRPLFRNGEQTPYAVIALFEDVTEARNVEESLQLSQRSLAKAQEIAHIGSWELDLNTNRTAGSPETYRILGLDPHGPSLSHERYINECVHEDDRQVFVETHASAVKRAELQPLQYRIRRKTDNAVRYVRAQAEFVFGPDGRRQKLFGTLQDITELIETRDKLTLSEERYRTIVETTQEWIWEVDASGRNLFSNVAIQEILGYRPEELQKGNILQHIAADDRDTVRRKLFKHAQERTGWSHWTVRWVHKDGTIRVLESNAKPVFDGERNLLGFRGSDRDITARIEAEEQIRQHQQTLAHVSRLTTMGEMVAGIAHEVNQPLAAISNFADATQRILARNQTDPDPRVKKWLTEIAEQAVRCGDIIRRLRGFVKKSDADRSRVNVSRIVADSIGLLQHEIRRHSVDVDYVPGRHDIVTLACETQLQQVIVNLLRNGIDAVAGLSDATVSVDISTKREWVLIIIRDNGPGVSTDIRDNLFDAFYSTKSGGMGLGLAISKSIIESHDGRLTISDDTKRGAEFLIELPAAPCANSSLNDQSDSIRS